MTWAQWLRHSISMTSMKGSARWIAVAFMCCVATGCRPAERATLLGGGYEEVTYVRTHISEPESHQITLQFRAPAGDRVMVWPSLQSSTVMKDGVAVFVAARTVGWSHLDKVWETGPRLFAVRAPDTVLDITSEVVARWAKASGKDLQKALSSTSPLEPKEQEGKLSIPFAFGVVNNWPSEDIRLSWTELLDVMREVKEKGVQHKDPKWNITYIEKEVKSEGQP